LLQKERNDVKIDFLTILIILRTFILDEIDGLITGNKEVLYRLFEWTTIDKSRLILLGIANAMDLTQRVLPDLKLKKCMFSGNVTNYSKGEPLLVNFVRYEKPEILKIMQQRIESVNPQVTIFDNAAMQLIANKVGSHSGDARKALEICRFVPINSRKLTV
jgi:cell division control protein 6